MARAAAAGAGMKGPSRALEEASWVLFVPLCLNYFLVYVLIPIIAFFAFSLPGGIRWLFIRIFLYKPLVKATDLTPRFTPACVFPPLHMLESLCNLHRDRRDSIFKPFDSL